jgi:hypothetical protein
LKLLDFDLQHLDKVLGYLLKLHRERDTEMVMMMMFMMIWAVRTHTHTHTLLDWSNASFSRTSRDLLSLAARWSCCDSGDKFSRCSFSFRPTWFAWTWNPKFFESTMSINFKFILGIIGG